MKHILKDLLNQNTHNSFILYGRNAPFLSCKGIKKGDEVILPAQTMLLLDTKNLWGKTNLLIVNPRQETSIYKKSRKITKKQRPVVVHFLGIPVDMLDKENKKKWSFNFRRLRISAWVQNLQKNSLFGDAGVFSFYPVKHHNCWRWYGDYK